MRSFEQLRLRDTIYFIYTLYNTTLLGVYELYKCMNTTLQLVTVLEGHL